MESMELVVAPRTVLGKRVRFLRRGGLIPANIYGPGMKSIAVEVDSSTLQRTLRKVGRNTPVTLKVNGQTEMALIWNVQRHPVTDAILHVDLFKVDPSRRIETTVAIRLVGKAPAVDEGAVIIQTLHDLHIQCPVVSIPKYFEIDVSPLVKINDLLLVKDLKVGPEIKVISPLDQPVVRAAPPRAEEVVAPAAAEVVPAEAEAAAAPAEAAAAPTAAPPAAEGAPPAKTKGKEEKK